MAKRTVHPRLKPGDKFGRLEIVEEAAPRTWPSGWSERQWICRCECGTEKPVLEKRLRSGNTKSCGCFRSERAAVVTRTHGLAGSREYGIHRNMITRCYNPKAEYYPDYGGRGITVCDGSYIRD